VPLASKS